MRPTDINEEVIDSIIESVKALLPYKIAADGVGVTDRTLYNWIVRGKQDLEDGSDTLFAKFVLKLKKAEKETVQKQLAIINKGETGWQAHAWILERNPRWRRHFSLESPEIAKLREEFALLQETIQKLLSPV